MAHVRTQIRNALRAALVAGLPASGYEVFGSRKYARNHTRATAVVDMRFLNINVERQTMDDARTHTASLYIRVQRDAAEDALDDALDADEVIITAVVEGADWSGLLEEDPELVQVNFSGDSEGDVALGSIILRYDVQYRINKSFPQTVIN